MRKLRYGGRAALTLALPFIMIKTFVVELVKGVKRAVWFAGSYAMDDYRAWRDLMQSTT